jgi:hypothetical protein
LGSWWWSCGLGSVFLAAAGGAGGSEIEALGTHGYRVVARAQDEALFERVLEVRNEVDEIVRYTQEFRLLSHGLHYIDPATGSWRESEEVWEPHAEGAVARRGAYQVILRPDLATEAAFEVWTSDQERLRGGPRALLLTDHVAKRSLTLATIRSCRGEIVAPNQVLFRDAFDGLEADVLYIWKRGAFSQNVILRQAPVLPRGWAAAGVRIEVLTEFVQAPVPELVTQVVEEPGKPPLVDDSVIRFGWMAAVPGIAYPVVEGTEASLNVTGHGSGAAARVAKEWFPPSADAGALVIESVDWTAVDPFLGQLPRRVVERAAGNAEGLWARVVEAESGGRTSPGNGVWRRERAEVAAEFARSTQAFATRRSSRPMEFASAAASTIPRGYLIDLELSGTVSSYAFGATTYLVSSTFHITGAATFNPGAVIKYAPEASISIAGSLTAPACSGTLTALAQLTSKDDDSVGEILPGSTGAPAHAARPALRLLDPASSTLVRRFRIRYAHVGVEYQSAAAATRLASGQGGRKPGSGGTTPATHTVQDCRFESCAQGVASFGTAVTVQTVVMCDTPVWTLNLGGGVFTTSGVVTDCAYYVATKGKNCNLGTVTAPWQTLAQAKHVSGPSTTVILRGGTYAESINGDWYGGLDGARVSTLKGYPGERPVLKPATGTAGCVLTFYGSGAVRAGASSPLAGARQRHILIDNLVLDGANQVASNRDGIKITDSAGFIRIVNCELRNTGNQGILVTTDDPNLAPAARDVGDCEFLGMHIHNWGQYGPSKLKHAVYVQAPRCRVTDSVFHDGPGHGVHAYANAPYNHSHEVSRCVFYQCGTAPGDTSVVGLYTGAGHRVFNNVIRNSPANGISLGLLSVDSPVGAEVAFNTIYACSLDGIEYDGLGSSAVRLLNNVIAECGNAGIYLYAGHGAAEVLHNLSYQNGLNNPGLAIEQRNFLDNGAAVAGAPALVCGNIGFAQGNAGCPAACSVAECADVAPVWPGVAPNFRNAAAGDLHLKSPSPADNAALALPAVPRDRDDLLRDTVAPTIGAYEL